MLDWQVRGTLITSASSLSSSRMSVTLMMMMSLLPLMPGSGSSKQRPMISYMMSPANTVSCRDKDKRLLEEVESAQLAAHRWGELTECW